MDDPIVGEGYQPSLFQIPEARKIGRVITLPYRIIRWKIPWQEGRSPVTGVKVYSF